MSGSSPGPQETSFTDGFWANGVEEAWVVIWPEHLGTKEFLEGVDLAELAADYQAMTGGTSCARSRARASALRRPLPPRTLPAPAPRLCRRPLSEAGWWDDFVELDRRPLLMSYPLLALTPTISPT